MLARCFRSVARARSISRGALERSSARLHLTSRSPASALSTTAFDSSIVHKSPHQDIVLPNKTIWNIVEDQARINGDKTAFICGIGHDVVTFHELYERAKRVAAGLANDGVGKGDAVVLHSFNCMEYPTVLLALASLGAICSPAPPTAQPVELASQIRESKASHIITHVELAQIALEAAKQADIATNFVYTMGDPSKSSESLTSIRDLTDRETGSFEFEDIDPELTALLPFSSGTTGVPKGVALSARNLLANALQIRQIEDLGSHSLGLLPYFHIYGMTLMNLSLCHGAANVVLPRFEPTSFLQALAKYKIRAAHIAPPVALFLAHHPMVDNYDLSATEFMVSGGAPMGKEVENLVEKRLQIPVKQAYGLTEASPAVNYTEDGFRKPGSVGRLVPNTELRVRCTATDVDLPIGEHGELLYRGPQVMIGYSNNQEANKSVFTDDGFLRTGDIGYIDEDGFVFIVDRVKELIKYKGHQVAPAELEDVLNKHPQIRDSCCVRGQDSFGEEIPKAFVVLKDAENSAGITETDIMEYVAENVAPFKKVRQLEFIDEIPKSATGKILRRQLQASENQQQRT